MKLCWEAMGSRVICERSPYIYPPSKVAVPRSNGSRLKKSIKVRPVNVSWGSWVLSVVLCDEVWRLDIGSHLPRVMFSAEAFSLNQELEPSPVPATI